MSTTRSDSGSATAASSARTSCASAGRLPRLLTATDAAGTQAVHELTNPDLELSDGRVIARPSRCGCAWSERLDAAGALRQRIAVRSYHREPIKLPLELRLGADFQPMLELRGIVPKHERPAA